MPEATLKPKDFDPTLDTKIQDRQNYRTTHMFSATMSLSVERLMQKYLYNPVIATIGSVKKATDNVIQRVIMCKENEKLYLLENELHRISDKRVIIFTNTQTVAELVQRRLNETGFTASVLHGRRTQSEREEALKKIKNEMFGLLVATDVAGRGIDIPDVALVINFEMANNLETYVHRIGRTGRAGKKGVALTFLTPNDSGIYCELIKLLEESKQTVPLDLLKHDDANVNFLKANSNKHTIDSKFIE